MSRPSASELREALRSGLAARLAPDGWQLVGDEGRWAAGLVRPVADDFVATIEVWEAGSVPGRPPVLITYMHAGVGYEPLRQLSPLLDRFDLAVHSTLVWPQFDDEDDEDDEDQEDEEDEEEFQPRKLWTLAEADQLASELAVVAQGRAVPYAERYADFDRLLARVSGPDSGGVRAAALLASAGRFDEARTALEQVALPDPGASLDAR